MANDENKISAVSKHWKWLRRFIITVVAIIALTIGIICIFSKQIEQSVYKRFGCESDEVIELVTIRQFENDRLESIQKTLESHNYKRSSDLVVDEKSRSLSTWENDRVPHNVRVVTFVCSPTYRPKEIEMWVEVVEEADGRIVVTSASNGSLYKSSSASRKKYVVQ